MKLFAIHAIHHRIDPEKPEQVVAPGYVFDMPDEKEAKFLVANGAARTPTDDELKLYALANGAKLVEAKPAAQVVAGSKPNPDDLLGDKGK